jgi:site-specific DNA-methyltransferase (adenine-specific)
MTPFSGRVERIGDATLYLGDAREIAPALGPIDFIFTDPPYGHNNNNNGDLIHRREVVLGHEKEVRPGRPIENDGAGANDLARWLFSFAKDALWPGSCCCCCCGGGGPDPQFARWSLWMDELLGFKQMVVWDKGPMGMGWHYRRSYETVLVGQKPGAACRWYDETDCVENIIRPRTLDIRKILPSKDDHPTPKHWRMAAHFMALHTKPGELVLDPFMGGGSTIEAAIKTGRRVIGIEIDPKHFERSLRRAETAQREPVDMFLAPIPIDPADQRAADLFAEPEIEK